MPHLPPPRRWLPVALAATIVLLLLLSSSLHAALLGLLARAEALAAAHPVWAALLVIGYAAASAMLVFLSSGAIAPFLTYTWGLVGAFLLLWTGWLVGGALSYAIGRFLGRPVVERLASPRLLQQYHHLVSHRMSFPLVLLFQLALPSELPGYLLGMAGYRFLPYAAALGLAEVPYAIATVLLGAGLVSRELKVLIPVGVAIVVLGVWSLTALRKRIAGVPPAPS